MRCPKWITAQDLDRWAASPAAKVMLPDLVRRLVFATVPREHLREIDFPSGTEVQRPGYDGTTLTDKATAFVPAGICVWELSCQKHDCRGKAQGDYDKRLAQHQQRLASGHSENLRETTFVAVTATDWQDAGKWADERTQDGHFKQVLAYDSSRLEQWIQDAPAVGLWLAQVILGPREGLEDLAAHWACLQQTLRQPLPPQVLLVNRETICQAFAKWLDASSSELVVQAPSTAEIVAVFCAWVQTLSPPEQDAISSRAVIVEARESWRELATARQGLILVASPRLEAEPELSAEAVRHNHHVLRSAEHRVPHRPEVVEMPRMRRFDLQVALERAGLSNPEAKQLAEAAGGNFTILRRRLASGSYRRPAWADDEDLAPLILAVGWEDASPDDQRIVAQLADRPYSDVQRLMTKWRNQPDAPVRLTLGKWEFLSPTDAWEVLSPLLTSTQVGRFEAMAVEVLSEENPALDLPGEERVFASVRGRKLRFSETLRAGVAEVLALSVARESGSADRPELRLRQRAETIVARVLPEDCGWKRWASLNTLLPLLMEAAPDKLLARVERDLTSPNPQLAELLRQEIPGAMVGAIYHHGLLWALETAAWTKEFMSRVALCLIRLAKLDSHDSAWRNRPMTSLVSLFLPWRCQTTASVEERAQTLEYLRRKDPASNWTLLLGLLPGLGQIVGDSAKPAYRDWAAGWTDLVSQAEHRSFLSQIVNMVLAEAGTHPERWLGLVEHIGCFSQADFEKAVEGLGRLATESLDPDSGARIWRKLYDFVQWQTYSQQGPGALPSGRLDKLATLRDRFAPKDVVTSSIPLFERDAETCGDRSLSYDEKHERTVRERALVIRAIWISGGLADVLRLARCVRQGWTVGLALGGVLGREVQPEIVPSLLVTEEGATLAFARGFAAARLQAEGREWAETTPTSEWTPAQVAAWAQQMPFDPRTWDWAASRGEQTETAYWSAVGVDFVQSGEAVAWERAARQYLARSRPGAALHLFALAKHVKHPICPALVCDILEAVASGPANQSEDPLHAYHIHEALAFLQDNADADEARVAGLEWVFLPLLDHAPRLPRTLHMRLARDPGFFVECLATLYRPKSPIHNDAQTMGGPQVPQPAEVERARRVWQLFFHWQILPGTDEDGCFSAEDLHDWVREARRKTAEADRIEVGDLTLGQVFARSPEDADHAKPLVAIREVIEECESEAMERGLAIGLHNLRGVHSGGGGGQQERDLAAIYQRYADICGRWPRVAKALRRVATGYLREAEVEDEEARASD